MNDPVAASTRPRRRWLQFKLRTAFIALTLAGIVLGIGLRGTKYIWWETWLAKRLEARGATVNTTSHSLTGPITYLGVDKAKTIDRVSMNGQKFVDADLAALTSLPNLKELGLSNTSISLLAAGRMPESCQVLPWPMAPSEGIYAHCRQRDDDSFVEPCLAVVAYEWALKWKLACARGERDIASEQRAYQQCIDNLRKLPTPHPADRVVGDEIYAAKIASLEMRLAESQGDTAKAIEIGDAWQARMQDAEQSAWPTQANVSFPYRGDHFLTVTRLTREICSHTARLRGDQQAEVQASDEAFVAIRTTLRTLLSPTRPYARKQMRELWASTMVIALEAEKLQRAMITGEVIAEADDIRMVRRLTMARDDVLGQLQSSSVYQSVDHLREMLAWTDQLIFEARRRHEKIAEDRQFDQEYTEYLQRLASKELRQPGYDYYSQGYASSVVVYLLRCQERTGLPVSRLKQHELNSLIPWLMHGTWPRRAVPTTDDWRREFPELNIVLRRPPLTGSSP